MPELPEVENVKQKVEKAIIGKKILSLQAFSPKLRYKIPAERFPFLQDTQIMAVKRKGKFIIIETSGMYSAIIHLGMSGHIDFSVNPVEDNTHNFTECEPSLPPLAQQSKHHHFTMAINGMQLHYYDPRKFGLLAIEKTADITTLNLFKNIGTDPCDELTVQHLNQLVYASGSNMKSFLMNQKFIAGIGNIYASEIMFRCNISPYLIAKKLPEEKIPLLHTAIKDILQAAITYGGSTLRNYKKPGNEPGKFQTMHKVYAKSGKPCFNCSNTIEKIVQNGRSTFYCSVCQKH